LMFHFIYDQIRANLVLWINNEREISIIKRKHPYNTT